jgi:hypothetical protein
MKNTTHGNSEPLISAPAAQPKLAAGPTEAKRLPDPLADLKGAKKIQTAIEVMEALVDDKLLKYKADYGYEPVDPKNKVAAEAIQVFRVLKNRLKEKELSESRATQSARSRQSVNKIVTPDKSQAA